EDCLKFVPPIFLKPSVGGVPDDREQPRPAVSATKPAKELERTQECLLYDVLRVVLAPGQPPRQIVRGVQMWHDQLFKTGLFIVLVHECSPSAVAFTLMDSRAPYFVPGKTKKPAKPIACRAMAVTDTLTKSDSAARGAEPCWD